MQMSSLSQQQCESTSDTKRKRGRQTDLFFSYCETRHRVAEVFVIIQIWIRRVHPRGTKNTSQGQLALGSGTPRNHWSALAACINGHRGASRGWSGGKGETVFDHAGRDHLGRELYVEMCRWIEREECCSLVAINPGSILCRQRRRSSVSRGRGLSGRVPSKRHRTGSLLRCSLTALFALFTTGGPALSPTGSSLLLGELRLLLQLHSLVLVPLLQVDWWWVVTLIHPEQLFRVVIG